jgi:hypothetical protein
VAMFLVGRFLNGVGVGMMQVTVPAYMVSPSVWLARCNPTDVRYSRSCRLQSNEVE